MRLPRNPILPKLSGSQSIESGFSNLPYLLFIITLIALFLSGLSTGITFGLKRGLTLLEAVGTGLLCGLLPVLGAYLALRILEITLEWRACPRAGTRVEFGFGPHKGKKGLLKSRKLSMDSKVEVQIDNSDEMVVVPSYYVVTLSSENGPSTHNPQSPIG